MSNVSRKTKNKVGPVSLTLFFIVEPPEYEVYACYLAASIREQFGKDVRLIGYCPSHRAGEVDPNVRTLLDRMTCDFRTFDTAGKFDPDYPHGNKLLATLERRGTKYSGFLDSDILCLRPNTIDALIKPNAVSLTLAASLNWAPQEFWTDVYDLFEMPLPEERHMLARQKKGEPKLPYFSSGLVIFPEHHISPKGLTFAETWMDTAQTIDASDKIPSKRPYLDQISLPLAIKRAGLAPNLLNEREHYILGGKLRGKPLPTEDPPKTVHYRRWVVLNEAKLAGQAKAMMQKQAGVKRVYEVGTEKDVFERA